MKGLRKYLTPFAPDQSGAVSMCYALGGMVVIVDAGGCAGNICGFDEPRWQPDYLSTFSSDTDSFGQKEYSPAGRRGRGADSSPRVAAVFSAGLRDMDAILGRDDLLIRKLAEASKEIDVKFIALVGTPVPAVIGTDLRSDAAMAQKLTNLPCIAVCTDGMHLYDKGIEEALLELVKHFVPDPEKENPSDRKEKKICSVLGMNPLDLFDPAWTAAVRSALLAKGYDEVLLCGMDGGLDALKRCSLAEKNYVVSPAGIAAAGYLKDRFGIPYEVSFPADPMILLEENPTESAKAYGPGTRILIVHQQVLADSIRRALRSAGAEGEIVTATWFDWKPELSAEGDLKLKEEDDFISLVREGSWDLIIADPVLRPMASGCNGRWIDAFHFAVSGQAAIDRGRSASKTGQSPAAGSGTDKVEVWRI